MFNANRDDGRKLFGPASVFLCDSTRKDHNIANRRGLATSQIVAIAKLKQFSYQGKAVGVEKLKKKLKLDPSEDFAIALRIYPEASKIADARLNDITMWRSSKTPNIVIENQHDETNLVNSLNSHRKVWRSIIAPSLDECYQDYDPTRYYLFLKNRVIYQMAHMIRQGFSPCTQFSNSERAFHNHLQNVTPHGLHTELTPMAYINRLTRTHKRLHYASLVSSTHDTLVTTGLQVLSPKNFVGYIPESLAEVQQALYKLTKDKDLREIKFTPEHHAPEQLLDFARQHANLIH